MIWKAKDIQEYINKGKEEQIYICEKKETKAWRLLTQNRMFKWLFWEISKTLWINARDVQWFFMKALFWVKEIELFWQIQEIALINSTTELTKEEAIHLIDKILEFIQAHKINCKYTSREFESLIESYN
jgi:hypothetical protein